MNYLKTIWFGIQETLRNKKYALLLGLISVVMMSLFVLVPTWTVDGNTVSTQLTLFTPIDLFILALLTIISALYMTMQMFVMRTGKKIQGVGATVGGAFGALFAGITGTAFCASCLAPLFAIFGIGFGGLIFVLEYRLYFVIAVLTAMLIALYLTARKIKKVCVTC
jgi:Flp pilus assembly pilin Flp